MAEVVAGFLIGAGLWFLGFYVGLGVREDREAERHARIALARANARGAAGPTVYLMAPPPAAADPFPRPGRLALGAGYITGVPDWPALELTHGPAPRPATSLVDLDGAVRLMCIEAEQYVANLIAGTRHAERGHPW
jgi:hypothetical protein